MFFVVFFFFSFVLFKKLPIASLQHMIRNNSLSGTLVAWVKEN